MSYKNNKFKISARSVIISNKLCMYELLQHGMRNLNYLMDHILHQIFKIILNIYLKSMGKKQLILQ